MSNSKKHKNLSYIESKTPLPISPIELLEYSKDNIRKVNRWNNLPVSYQQKLMLACYLINDTQEYLFYN